MILPTKRLSQERALLVLGADILGLLDEPKTISRVWGELRQIRSQSESPITFDWFVLALDFLYLCNAIDANHGRIRKHMS